MNFQAFAQALPQILLGWLGVFVVTILIVGAVMLLQNFNRMVDATAAFLEKKFFGNRDTQERH